MNGVDAGALDREIDLQIATKTQDAETGEEVLTWASVTTEVNGSRLVPAQWLPGGTTEAFRSQQRLGSFIDGVFRIRDRETRPVPDANRIVFESRTYDIKGCLEDAAYARGEALLVSVVARGE
jgi:head-tail adaptor